MSICALLSGMKVGSSPKGSRVSIRSQLEVELSLKLLKAEAGLEKSSSDEAATVALVRGDSQGKVSWMPSILPFQNEPNISIIHHAFFIFTPVGL